jgi:sugar/nucleoside kinase (ribokinase family)
VPKPDFDLLVIGDINADLVLKGDDPVPVFGQVEKLVDLGLLTIGGSSGIMACAAARLGLRTACIGVLGDDALGSYMRSALQDRGVDTSACPVDADHQTGITVTLTSSDGSQRAMLTATGTAGELTAQAVSGDMLHRSRHLHCGSYFLQPRLQPQLAALFIKAKRLGLTCSLDTNWDPTEKWDHGLRAVLQRCDLFLPNEQEAMQISGCADAGAAAAKLSESGATVAVKLGRSGALVRHGSRSLRATAPAVDVIDTIGAGDAFDAGYIFGSLLGWDAEQCLSLAVACGTLSTRAVGGVDGQPTLDEAQALASTIRVGAI